MPIASLRRVLAGAVLLGALFAATVSPAHAATTTAAPSMTAGAFRICTNCAATGGNMARYGYVVLNSWDAPRIPALKAANPELKVLVYKNLSFAIDYTCSVGIDNADLPAGVGYCDAYSNHPDWFLRDSSGNRIHSYYFGSHWMMDVGNVAYQSKWLANVTADAKAHGFDGVWADDTNVDMSWHLNGQKIAKYPTIASWTAATRSMLANVGPALRDQGIMLIPNISAPWSPSYDALAVWKDWIQFTSGANQEFFSKWGYASSSWFTGDEWTFRQQFQTATEAAGKIFLALSYAPRSDSRSMSWARANFLLGTSNPRSALMFEPTDPEANDPYSPTWTAEIGTPTGARYQVGAAWRRDFTGGTVVVNPSTSTVTVPLGNEYVNDAGATVTSVTLPSATGAVLGSKAADDAPPPPVIATPPPTPVKRITLVAQQTARNRVTLTWTAPPAAKIDLYHNDWWFAVQRNDGVSVQKVDNGPPGTYRVCLVDGSLCSPAVPVTR